MDHASPANASDAAIAAGHELSDIKTRSILIVAIILAVGSAAVSAVLAAVMGLYGTRERQAGSLRPTRFADTAGQFPNPRLQGNPAGELLRMRAADHAALESYGWVDRPAGIAHLPIERAIDVVAEKGLPTQKHQEKGP